MEPNELEARFKKLLTEVKEANQAFKTAFEKWNDLAVAAADDDISLSYIDDEYEDNPLAQEVAGALRELDKTLENHGWSSSSLYC